MSDFFPEGYDDYEDLECLIFPIGKEQANGYKVDSPDSYAFLMGEIARNHINLIDEYPELAKKLFWVVYTHDNWEQGDA